MQKLHRRYWLRGCLIWASLILYVGILHAYHPISSALYQLLDDGNIEKAKESISGYSINELAALPDSVLLDYYYLKGLIKQSEGENDKKRAYLIAAKELCEKSVGIHSPLYLELCWAIGKSFEESGDTVSAFETYQAALIQSVGFYTMDDDDVKWYYQEINNSIINWYKDEELRQKMINHRDKLSAREISSDAPQNDMEFYTHFYKDEFSKELLNKADSLSAAKAWKEAAELYEEVAQITRNNPIAQATVNALAASCYMDIEDIQSSEKLLLENIHLLENHKKSKIYRRSFSLLSNLYNSIHNFDKGKQYAYLAKFWYEENLDFSRGYILCLHRCASLERGEDNHFLALLLTDFALQELCRNNTFDDYWKETTSRDAFLCNLLASAALHYNQFGCRKEAISNLSRVFDIAEANDFDSSPYYNNMVELCIADRKFDDAVEFGLKAYEQSDSENNKIVIGATLCLSQFLAKQPISENALVESSQYLQSLVNKTFSFTSMDERKSFWSYFEYYYPLINFLIYQSGNTELHGQIFNNIIEEKGLLLRTANRLRDQILQNGNEEDVKMYDHLLLLRESLLSLSTEESQEVKAEIETLDKELTRKFSKYADFANSNGITWTDVRNHLNEGEIAIEFYNIPEIKWHEDGNDLDGKYRYCAVTVQKGYKEPHIIPLFTDDRLQSIDQDDIYDTDSIYNLIWKPLEQELKGIKNVYFAADRELHKIGIEYAPMPKGGIIRDKYNLYRVSSTRVLAENNKDGKKENAVLYGGLNYDMGKDDLIAESRSGDFHPTSVSRAFTDENLRYGVKYLPGTLKEVEDIAKGFVHEPRVITDVTGTEESFKSLAGTPIDIIHLATHGFFWSDEDAQKRDYVTFLNPNNKATQSTEDKALMRSGLFFSGANVGLKGESLPDDVEDGVLTALELSNMNLGNVDMVVMSACESGLGETSGEGVFGLQRGFKLAGANTLLMSLWKVDDTATQILMTEFYRHYLSGKSKQESLRLAQKSLRDNPEYSDPQYWAAFILLDGLN